MKGQVKEVLMQKEGYSPHSAESTAKDLENIKDSEISRALILWIDTGKKTNISRGPFSCRQLMTDLQMKYPATLIFLDWYCEDPESAVASIRYGGGQCYDL